MRAVCAVALVAFAALVASQPTALQFPQYIATMDCGLPNSITHAFAADTSVAIAATNKAGNTGVCAAATATGSQGACFVNTVSGVTTVNMTYQGIPSTWTAAHLHGLADPPTVDPVLTSEGVRIVTTTWTNQTAACFTSASGATPSGSCGNMNGQGILSSAQVASFNNPMYNMNWYCNIHSSQYPNGEIRGQIYPATPRYMASCDGKQSGVSATSGSCSAWCTLTAAGAGTATCGGQWWGLLGNVTAAHVHLPAPQGATTGVWLTFTFPSGQSSSWGVLSGSQASNVAPIITSIDPLVAIRSDWAYVNVHTNLYAGGEVRGQLHMVNSDPQNFAPTTTTATAMTYYSTNGQCLAVGNGMYWKGCTSISGQWQLAENVAYYTDAACTSIQSAQNRWSTLYNQGVHKLWGGMDVTRHSVSSVTAVSNSASDITAWQANCACGGTWVVNVPRTVSGCSCSLLTENYRAGVFNSTGYWFSGPMSSAMDVLYNTNVTTPASTLGWYTTPTTTINQCVDYTVTFHSAAPLTSIASAITIAIATIVAFIAARV